MKIFYRLVFLYALCVGIEFFFSPLGLQDRNWLGIDLLGLSLAIIVMATAVGIYFRRRRQLQRAREVLHASGLSPEQRIIRYFDVLAEYDAAWKKRHSYYHDQILKLAGFLIPRDASVLEVGCGTGHLLGRLPHKHRTGIDFSSRMIQAAAKNHPQVKFEVMGAEALDLSRLDAAYDYIFMSDLIPFLNDVQKAFEESAQVMHAGSRLITTSNSYLWEPWLRLLEKLHWKMPQPRQHWLSMSDIQNLMELAGLTVVKKGTAFMFPLRIPVLSGLMNKFLVRFPLIRHLGMIQYLVAKKVDTTPTPQDFSVSIVVPARNEAGNIEAALQRTPPLGRFTEFIFVEGHSTDHTWEEIQRVAEKYSSTHRIKILQQPGEGKGDAVRAGFKEAEGDILTILDGDLTVPPEQLPKFYQVIVRQQADFVNGCRLIYPMEKKAMRFFNVLGNKFFSLAFTWLLDQPIKDTLCGTKMLLKKDYERIAANRAYFGDFDPFGDYDLLFGASKLNLKIMEVPIRYQARTYGDTNIQRWKHGLLLFRMVFFAMRKIKFF